LQQRYRDFQAAGSRVVAISSSSVENHKSLAERIGASFPILSDPEGKTIRQYGLLHPGALPGFDLPVSRPAEILLDENGIVRQRFLTENWRIRARPERLLEMLKKLE